MRVLRPGDRPKPAPGHSSGRVATTVGAVLLASYVGLALIGRFGALDPNRLVTAVAEPPSLRHPFGTDTLGRDLFARISVGAWTSLTTSVGAVALAVAIAVPVGVLAAHRAGRWTDHVLMRTVETIQAVPPFVLAVVVLGMVGTDPSTVLGLHMDTTAKVVVCLALGFVPFFSRVTRAATVVELQEDYVEGLRLVGVPEREVLVREVLPNVGSAITVQVFLALAIAVFGEGGLSAIGLGVPPAHPTLGSLVADAGAQLLDGAWWYALLPGLTLVAGITGCNLVADAVADRDLRPRVTESDHAETHSTERAGSARPT